VAARQIRLHHAASLTQALVKRCSSANLVVFQKQRGKDLFLGPFKRVIEVGVPRLAAVGRWAGDYRFMMTARRAAINQVRPLIRMSGI
jgi:hypothetical protein